MTEYGKVLLTSLLITFSIYVIPILLVRISDGPKNRSDANKLALTTSIVVGLGFIFYRSSNQISGSTSSTAPLLYFFVNKAILRFGYKNTSNNEEILLESGAGKFDLRDEKIEENQTKSQVVLSETSNIATPEVINLNVEEKCGSIVVENKVSEEIICSKCKTINPKDSKYCIKCGSPLEKPKMKVFCNNCGVKLIENAEFCHKCGKSVNRA